MHIRSLFLSAVAAGLATAASSDPTLSQLIASDDNLSELGKLLKQYPSVGKTIAAAGQVTVFAPTNDAIEAWSKTSIGQGISSEFKGIQELLAYHVLPQVVYSSAISTTPIFADTLLKTANGEAQVVEASVEDGNVVITSGLEIQSKVIKADLNCTSGVVHVIDKVLYSPVNYLETGLIGGLDYFTGACLKLQHLGTTLETGSNYTFFAPTNEAFVAIGSAAAGLSSMQLADVLKYHVVKGVVYSTDLKDERVETLDGKQITVTVEGGGAFVNAARIINANILVEEGVLHVIDSVLNPDNSTAKPDPSASAAAVQFSGASSADIPILTKTLPPASTHASVLTETVMMGGAATTAGGAKSSASMMSGAMGGSSATSAAASVSSSAASVSPATGGAAIATAAVGAMAFFGGAALFGNM